MKTVMKTSAFVAAVFGVVLGAQAGAPTPNYLTFTAEEAGSTVKLGWDKSENVEINTNGTWEEYTKNAALTLANVGDKVQFRGRNVVTGSMTTKHFRMTGTIAASGSVTSLIDANGGDPYVVLPEKCFYSMFSGCTNMTVAPELPALNLTNQCYASMFSETWLTKAPKLPATELKLGCYANMFASCKYLLNPAPLDHVTTLAMNCCRQMYSECQNMKVYTDNTHEGCAKPWKATSATEGAQDWSTDMFPATEGGLQGTPTVGVTYFVNGSPVVTVEIPEVAGATAGLFAFDVNGGWASVATNEVPSNATVRVVWMADADKALTGEGAKNVYMWQSAAFVADKAEQTAPAPTVVGEGESEVTIAIDTRGNKTYFDAAKILPVWYAAGAEVKVQGQGQEWTNLVLQAANTNTVVWTPTERNTYTLTQTGLASATITLSDPVEVKTNGLAFAGTTVEVMDDAGQPLVAQTESPYEGKLIYPSNSTVKVVWTATNGVYFADGTSVQEQVIQLTKSVNTLNEMVTPVKEPLAPSVKVGVVAQRYPWNGMVDVQCKVMNTPAKTYDLLLEVEIDGVKKYNDFLNAQTGVSTYEFDVKKSFGEVTAKKCRFSASLQKKK